MSFKFTYLVLDLDQMRACGRSSWCSWTHCLQPPLVPAGRQPSPLLRLREARKAEPGRSPGGRTHLWSGASCSRWWAAWWWASTVAGAPTGWKSNQTWEATTWASSLTYKPVKHRVWHWHRPPTSSTWSRTSSQPGQLRHRLQKQNTTLLCNFSCKIQTIFNFAQSERIHITTKLRYTCYISKWQKRKCLLILIGCGKTGFSYVIARKKKEETTLCT